MVEVEVVEAVEDLLQHNQLQPKNQPLKGQR
jgi:hypothetical protein